MSTLVNAKKLDVADEYLYHTEEAAGIIIDYEPPPESDLLSESKNKDSTLLNRPDFIYGPNQGPRVVEFYAPWCPHVRAFVVDNCIACCSCFAIYI
jgi:thiol-disulfide isomerase/thioredoxin